MAWAAGAHALGIIAGVYCWRPALWWLIAGATFVFAAVYFSQRRARLGWWIALGALFIAGALHIQARGFVQRINTSIQPYADGQEVKVTARVTHDGRLRPGSLGEIRQILDLETEQITTSAGQVVPAQSGLRLSIYRPRAHDPVSEEDPTQAQDSFGPARTFHCGDRIVFSAKLKLPRNFRNPGAFDYRGYLADRGITALASAKADTVELLPGFSGSWIGAWRSRIHRDIVAEVHQLWEPRQAALIDAMVIGDEAFIDRDTRMDFQRSGTYHVLVVSGMNLSILAFVVFWTLRRLRLPDVPATALTVLLCVTYAFVTEVGAPVWRATLMCAVYLTTRLLYRERAMVNALGAAALALLVFDPRQLFTASFQMTFLCVLIVSAICIPILQRTSQLYKGGLAHWDSPDYAAFLPPEVAQFRVELQLIASRIARFIGKNWSGHITRGTARFALTASELVFVSAVMQIGLALPMAYYFHRATTIGMPANLVVVPLTQLLMPAAVAAIALGFVSPWLAKVPAVVTTLALQGITGTVRGLGATHIADLRVPMPSFVMMLLAAAALALAITAARRRPAVVAAGLAAVLVASLALTFIPLFRRSQRSRPVFWK